MSHNHPRPVSIRRPGTVPAYDPPPNFNDSDSVRQDLDFDDGYHRHMPRESVVDDDMHTGIVRTFTQSCTPVCCFV